MSNQMTPAQIAQAQERAKALKQPTSSANWGALYYLSMVHAYTNLMGTR
jgi:hypothetical protein